MEEKIKNGVIHCANYVCNGCPYQLTFEEESKIPNPTAKYVRCMQKLINDIYNTIKEVEE